MVHLYFGRCSSSVCVTENLTATKITAPNLLRPLKMSARILTRKSRRMTLVLLTVAVFALNPLGSVFSQIVQLPTAGTFSLQTSVMVPDSGSAELGGYRRNAVGSQSLGPGSLASGASRTSAMATVRATIIDLNELDLMIRSQAGSKPTSPDFVSNQSRPSQYASGQKGVPLKNAEYEYLAAITHREKTGPDQMSSDATYYLSLASNAKQQRHWAAVELYYKLAWESLPERRRESVLKSLLEARSNVATGQGKKSKVDVK